ncbi:MAG TPA: hypothetical protein VJB98_01495 [Candidatus Paceibacterota bacterium]
MTVKTSLPITSDQRRQLRDFVNQAIAAAIKSIKLDSAGFQRLISRGGEFLEYLKEGIRRFSAAAPDYALARTILGKDFVSPEEVMATRKSVAYSEAQIAELGRTLPSQEILEWYRDHGYALVPAPSTAQSLAEHHVLTPTDFREGNTWFLDPSQKFSHTDKTSPGWLAIKRTIVESSTSKTSDEQQLLLLNVERVPNAAELHWFITVYHEVRNQWLFPNIHARTSSVDRDGAHVFVGGSGGRGPYVDGWYDLERGGRIGLAASRKFGN